MLRRSATARLCALSSAATASSMTPSDFERCMNWDEIGTAVAARVIPTLTTIRISIREYPRSLRKPLRLVACTTRGKAVVTIEHLATTVPRQIGVPRELYQRVTDDYKTGRCAIVRRARANRDRRAEASC